jgi:hypothetical protein
MSGNFSIAYYPTYYYYKPKIWGKVLPWAILEQFLKDNFKKKSFHGACQVKIA